MKAEIGKLHLMFVTFVVLLLAIPSFGVERPLVSPSGAKQANEKKAIAQESSGKETPYVIERAVMCEDIQDMEPVREAIVFSVEKGHIICFTAVKNIERRTYLIHRWIHKDEVTTTMRLKLRPPYWRTYSKIQLRETDKGPWRVEIVDPKGNILKVLRFSVTD